MKKTLVIDDNQDVWAEADSEYRSAGIELQISEIGTAPIGFTELSSFDKVIIHDHGLGGSTFSNRVEFELMESSFYEHPISIVVVNNDPDVNLNQIRERWARYEQFFTIQSFYRLPIAPELILADIENIEPPADVVRWLKHLKFPARLIQTESGRPSINDEWTWAENVPSTDDSVQDKSIVIFPSEKDDRTFRIVSSRLSDDLVLQTAFPMESPSQDPADIRNAISRQLLEFGFTRSRIYLIRNVPESHPVLELVSCYGQEYPDRQTVVEFKQQTGMNIGRSESDNIALELDDLSTELVLGVCSNAKDTPVFARASRAYSTASNPMIREFHKLLDITEEAEVLYISFYGRDGRLRGLVAADTGNSSLHRNAAVNLNRNLENMHRLLEGLSEALLSNDNRYKAELSRHARERLLTLKTDSGSGTFVKTAREFLRQSLEIYPVSLAVLAWVRGENLAPYVVAIELNDEHYSDEEARRLRELELSIAHADQLPAVYHAATDEAERFFLTGLRPGDYPGDLNGHRPRCGFPLLLGGKMRGVVGFSVPGSNSRLFSRDIELLKTIWDTATPTLFYLDQIRSYSERIDITRHDIHNTASNISSMIDNINDEFVRGMVNEELRDLVGLDGFLSTPDAGTMNAYDFRPTAEVSDLLKFLIKLGETQRKRISVDSSEPEIILSGDAGIYRSAARNIVKNAIVHGERIGHPGWLTVHVRMFTDCDFFVLEVTNPGKLDREPPEAVAGYRKGSQRALIILEKMLQPYQAKIDLMDTSVEGRPTVSARLCWPLKEESLR